MTKPKKFRYPEIRTTHYGDKYRHSVKLVLKSLERIDPTSDKYKCSGICAGLVRGSEYLVEPEILAPFFKKWNKFSGNVNYPVPATRKNSCPHTQYANTSNYYKGKYGQLRLELLQFCIAECKALINAACARQGYPNQY